MEKKKKTPDEIKKGLEICKQGGNWYDTCGKGCPYVDDEECAKALPADALEHIQQLEAKVPKWISVEERLPDSAGLYLVAYHPCWGDDVDINRCEVGIDTFRGRTTWAKRKFQRVTHWMPLPEPPEV